MRGDRGRAPTRRRPRRPLAGGARTAVKCSVPVPAAFPAGDLFRARANPPNIATGSPILALA